MITRGETMQAKTILLDVDGTLYDNANKRVLPSTIKALEKLKARGHNIVVATGRAYFMLYSIEEITHLVDHYILINGQYIIVNGKTIYEDIMDTNEIEALVKVLQNFNIVYGFQSTHSEAISDVNPKVIEIFEEIDLDLPPVDINFYKQNKVYQMWCFCSEEEARKIEEIFPNYEFVKWLTSGFDIIKKGQSKGKGLNIFIDHLGIDSRDIIAIGDGDNDIEMIAEAAIGIAMDNSTDKLKEAADYITDDVSEDGIYNALKHFNLI